MHFFFLFLFCLFRAAPTAYGSSQARGLSGATVAAYDTSQQRQIQAVSVTYTTAHGNAGSLTHWGRPRIEPIPSWLLVGFVFAVPRWEFLFIYLVSYLLFRAVPAAYGSSQVRLELELQLPVCTTAIATWDPSCICDLHHSSRQRWILNPLSEDRDRTHIFMDTSRVHYHWATIGTPKLPFLIW